MKLLLKWIVVSGLIVIFISGCIKTAPKPHHIDILWKSENLPTRYANPEPITNPDGSGDTYVASTGFTFSNLDIHRHIYLEAIIIDEFNNPIDVPDPENILWSCDIEPNALVQIHGAKAEYVPHVIGKHIITVKYENLSSSIIVLVFKRLPLSNYDINCISEVSLSNYCPASTTKQADLIVTCDG